MMKKSGFATDFDKDELAQRACQKNPELALCDSIRRRKLREEYERGKVFSIKFPLFYFLVKVQNF